MPASPGPNRLGELYDQPNFGAIDIDWAAGTLRLSLIGVDRETKRQTGVRLDDLRGR